MSTPLFNGPHAQKKWMRLCCFVVLIVGVVCSTWSLRAQEKAQGRMLHEYLKAPSSLRTHMGSSSTSAHGSDLAKKARARHPSGEPPLTLNVHDNEPVLGAHGPSSAIPLKNPQGGLNPRNAKNSLDQHTHKVDPLSYFAAFDPSIIPYKRVVAQNKVVIDGPLSYAFAVEPGNMHAVDIRSTSPRVTEDVFWGTFLVRTQGYKMHPIPSISPEQAILKMTTEPKIHASIMRDDAGNHYIKTTHTGLVRLNIKLAVSRDYFNGAFLSTTWNKFPESKAISLPIRATHAAKDVLGTLGITREAMKPRQALHALVKHYRGFKIKRFPKDLQGDDVYKSISLSKLGVCRHRSFAFAISASALGIPTRYIYNEAHAFVEVFWPGQGWRRIDLGGSAEHLTMHSSPQNVHDAQDHALPEPASFKRELDHMNAKPGSEHSAGGTSIDAAKQSVSESKNALPADAHAHTTLTDSQHNDLSRDLAQPESNSNREQDTRQSVSIVDLQYSEFVRRGSSFVLKGRLLEEITRRPVAGRSIKVSLVGSLQKLTRLGRTKTQRTGLFELSVDVPKALSIGRWTLEVAFDGDAYYKALHLR